jgi:ubiquinone/menaquinone biosynthesis C-methylase UbiE
MVNKPIINDTISATTARRIYDRLGWAYDWAERFESRAKERALAWLELAAGQRVLNVGVGTGHEQAQLQTCVTPGGLTVGLDLSPIMRAITHARTRAALCGGDARQLPFADGCFDRLFSAYTLDLIPYRDLPKLLAGFQRVLRPGGRMVLISLTEGIDRPSRVLVAAWKLLYRVSPTICGGCRPLQLSGLVQQAGFHQLRQEVVVQGGVPSEVLSAVRPREWKERRCRPKSPSAFPYAGGCAR